jgi:hypothetical protein
MMAQMAETKKTTTGWLLLIYTVSAEPSRTRAFIWRELKKVGAISIRDGVWALPESKATSVAFRRIAAKVQEFDGEATLAEGASIDAERVEAIRSASQTARTAEYEELAREAEHFLGHVRRESEHRNFNFAEMEELEQDLGKLRNWRDQVKARDYFGVEGRGRAADLLARCESALTVFLDEAFSQEDGTQ